MKADFSNPLFTELTINEEEILAGGGCYDRDYDDYEKRRREREKYRKSYRHRHDDCCD